MRNYSFATNTIIVADSSLCAAALCDLWNGFLCRTAKLTVIGGVENEMHIGTARCLPLAAKDEYTLSVTSDGIAIRGRDKKGLMRGFMTLLTRIVQLPPSREFSFEVPAVSIHGAFRVQTRMAHICIFPETSFSYFERLIRLCAVLQYTHIIIEFWGMLQFDCESALGWQHAFSKEAVRPVLAMARELGIEPVPMMNHLGHATQCRLRGGKHVVLDQKPELSYLYTPDGWSWDIACPETRTLLTEVRHELYDLFGDGDYIHLGCDEAYNYDGLYVAPEVLGSYLGTLSNEVLAEGRTPIMWADMLISLEEVNCEKPEYYGSAVSPAYAQALRSALPPQTIFADWQYSGEAVPWKTAAFLAQTGHSVLTCPWYKPHSITSAVDTAERLELLGVIETTWHWLSSEMHILLSGARQMGLPAPSWSTPHMLRSETATYWRKVATKIEPYEETGFSRNQVGDRY